MAEIHDAPASISGVGIIRGPGRPMPLAGATGAPAHGTGEAAYAFRFKHSDVVKDEDAEWLPAEEATHDDLGQPLPRPRRGHKHLLVYLDPEKHHASGEVALRLNVPEHDSEGAPATGTYRAGSGAGESDNGDNAGRDRSGKFTPR